MTTTSLDSTTVLEVVRAELAIAAPDVAPDAPADADLKHDLAVDSLSLLELVARLEFRYAVTVPDEDWVQLSSLKAIVDYIIAAST